MFDMCKSILFFAVLIIAIGCTVNSCSFSQKASKRLLDKASKNSYDVIVVPGIPLQPGQKWDSIMKARVYWSKYLYDNGIAKNIIYSGGAQYTAYYESKVMALYAVALGIPAEHIFIDTLAEHSTENIYYGAKMAKRLGFTTVALATDPFQAKQLRSFTRLRMKTKITIIPVVFDTLRTLSLHDPVIDPSSAIKKDFVSIKQRENGWKRFMGTLGFNRKRNAYK
jgi:uncharacterized SAM-binding protein YcdF (DUF218 family)